jgi:ribonuclease P protein component
VKREQRLRTSLEFRHAREQAPRGWPHPLLVVYAAPNDLDFTRVGITVSSRVGKAVVRNRVRRRLREALRACLPKLRPGLDVLVVARPASKDATWAELNKALDGLIARAGIVGATRNPGACV